MNLLYVMGHLGKTTVVYNEKRVENVQREIRSVKVDSITLIVENPDMLIFVRLDEKLRTSHSAIIVDSDLDPSDIALATDGIANVITDRFRMTPPRVLNINEMFSALIQNPVDFISVEFEVGLFQSDHDTKIIMNPTEHDTIIIAKASGFQHVSASFIKDHLRTHLSHVLNAYNLFAHNQTQAADVGKFIHYLESHYGYNIPRLFSWSKYTRLTKMLGYIKFDKFTYVMDNIGEYISTIQSIYSLIESMFFELRTKQTGNPRAVLFNKYGIKIELQHTYVNVYFLNIKEWNFKTFGIICAYLISIDKFDEFKLALERIKLGA